MFQKARSWLTIFRIHTANLTMAAVMIGLLCADKSLLSVRSVLFVAWAFLYHAQGFAENCVLDLEYDRLDPAKKHFALVNGQVKFEPARKLQLILMAATAITGILLAGTHMWAWIWLGAAIFFGSVYNHVSKKTISSPIYITIAFTAILLFPYAASGGGLSNLILAVAAVTSLQLIYQIGVEGFLKDIFVDRVNLLRSMGSRPFYWGNFIKENHFTGGEFQRWTRSGEKYQVEFVTPTKDSPRYSVAHSDLTVKFATLVKFSSFFALAAVCVFSWGELTIFAILCEVGMAACVGAMLAGHYLLLRDGEFDNCRVVKACSMIEVTSYFCLVFALGPMISVWYTLTLILFPLVWFLVMNQVIWGAWRPKV